MIFDAKEFEHFVDERSLKKGLRLFEKGLPEWEKSSALEYHFHIGSADIYIKKKGDKILSYNCSCGKARSCEHLGAAMFYFQQNELGLTKSNARGRTGKFAAAPPKPASVQRQKKLYDECSAAINELLKPFISAGKLDDRSISEVHTRLNAFLAHLAGFREDQLCVWLAAYAETAPLFSLRFAGDEKPLRQWYNTLEAGLSKHFKNSLSAPARSAWTMATMRSLRSDKCLDSAAFEFLLPRLLNMHPGAEDLEVLWQLLLRRKQKITYLRRISRLLIAEIQLFTRLHGNGVPLPFRYRRYPAECALALSGLDICAKKEIKGFERLEKAIEFVRSSQPEACQEYIDHLISISAQHHQRDLEIRLRRNNLLHSMFIRHDQLDSYLSLFPINKRQAAIETLLADMKQPPAVNTFDKIAALLMANNKLDDVMKEMSTHDLRFSLLNEVAMKKIDSCDEKFVKSYISQLCRVLGSSQNLQHQMRLFEQAKDFLQKLPANLLDRAAGLLNNEFPQNSRIGEHIRAFFRFSRIHLN